MKNKFDTIINIELVNTDKKSKINATFKCRECRTVVDCSSVNNCRLASYLKQRVPFIKTSMEKNPEIFIVSSNAEFEKTHTVVQRAIRMRKNRCR